MHDIIAENKCELFIKISSWVWDNMAYQIKAKIDPSEIGITKNIVSTLVNYNKRYKGIGVYANQGYLEKKYGTDIDLFIESTEGRFIWIALQSKILKADQTYDIRKKSGKDETNNYQWQKLQNLSAGNTCKAYYLLYNGIEEYQNTKIRGKRNTFNINQFGCSLVSLEKIIEVSFDVPKFNTFHPQYAEPWHVLVCNDLGFENLKTYTIEQILDRTSMYNKISSSKLFGFISDNYVGTSHKDIIKKISSENERDPAYTIIIRNYTYNSDKPF
jgi:hypothetical protein